MSAIAYDTVPSTGRWVHATPRHRCINCGSADWCAVTPDGLAWKCERPEKGRLSETRITPCKDGGVLAWIHGRPDDWQERLAATPPPPPRPLADPVLMDQAYRALLAQLTLSPSHRNALHRRGLDDAQIARHGYVTSPATAAAREYLAADIEREVGRVLAGVVPGFVRGKSGRTTLALGDHELLIPMRDLDHRIGGIRRRPDAPSDGRKYLHFSAGFQPGVSIGIDGHTVHVAYPRELHFAAYVVVVEGEIKANIVADLLGCIVISVAGVANINRVRETIAALGIADVIVAYDEDEKPETREQVARHEARLVGQLVDAGFRVARWTWPREKAKGLDDWLVAGGIPFPEPHPAMHQPRDATPADDALRAENDVLRRERDATSVILRARARIQRNTKLPARPMAIAVAGLLAHAATASKPAGDYDGIVPAGYVSAPVGTLAFDAGTQSANAGKQLERLEAAGIIARTTRKETLLAGQIDPETGEHLTTTRVFSRHFLAIAGHEQEPITPALVNEVVERMATFDSGVPEKRGGRRLRRCPDHPHDEVLRQWSTTCSACGRDLDAGGPEPVPTMLLEPLPPHHQSLMVRNETANDDPNEAAGEDNLPLRSKTPLGIRPIAHEVQQRGADAAHDQSLMVRRREAADDLLRFVKAEPDPEPAQPIAADFPEPIPLFPLDEPTECVGCGAYLSPGERHCLECDPRGG